MRSACTCRTRWSAINAQALHDLNPSSPPPLSLAPQMLASRPSPRSPSALLPQGPALHDGCARGRAGGRQGEERVQVNVGTIGPKQHKQAAVAQRQIPLLLMHEVQRMQRHGLDASRWARSTGPAGHLTRQPAAAPAEYPARRSLGTQLPPPGQQTGQLALASDASLPAGKQHRGAAQWARARREWWVRRCLASPASVLLATPLQTTEDRPLHDAQRQANAVQHMLDRTCLPRVLYDASTAG